jgi:hypothetical protein
MSVLDWHDPRDRWTREEARKVKTYRRSTRRSRLLRSIPWPEVLAVVVMLGVLVLALKLHYGLGNY